MLPISVMAQDQLQSQLNELWSIFDTLRADIDHTDLYNQLHQIQVLLNTIAIEYGVESVPPSTTAPSGFSDYTPDTGGELDLTPHSGVPRSVYDYEASANVGGQLGAPHRSGLPAEVNQHIADTGLRTGGGVGFFVVDDLGRGDSVITSITATSANRVDGAVVSILSDQDELFIITTQIMRNVLGASSRSNRDGEYRLSTRYYKGRDDSGKRKLIHSSSSAGFVRYDNVIESLALYTGDRGKAATFVNFLLFNSSIAQYIRGNMAIKPPTFASKDCNSDDQKDAFEEALFALLKQEGLHDSPRQFSAPLSEIISYHSPSSVSISDEPDFRYSFEFVRCSSSVYSESSRF